MIEWDRIATVFLDMDGTLLDLRFDNHFWREHVPLRYSEQRGIDVPQAKDELYALFRAAEGTLNWYSTDYWSDQLAMDIAELKRELRHMIAVLPHVTDFLDSVRNSGKRVVLLTNAHGDSVGIKLDETGIGMHFERIITSHELGEPKESHRFWPLLAQHEPHSREQTLLIDDNLDVLRAASRYGISHLVTIKRPDSAGPVQDTQGFKAIDDFSQIMPPADMLDGT